MTCRHWLLLPLVCEPQGHEQRRVHEAGMRLMPSSSLDPNASLLSVSAPSGVVNATATMSAQVRVRTC